MKRKMRSAIMLFFVGLLVAGCSLTSASEPNTDTTQNTEQQDTTSQSGGEHQDNPTNEENKDAENAVADENDLSPVPDAAPATVKETVTLFYVDKDLMDMYRVKREVEADHEDDLPKAALEAWMEGPEQDELSNLVPPEVVVEKVEFQDGIAYISFSNEIKNANLGSSGEMFLIEQITLLMEQFGYPATQILVEGELDESILGHVTTNVPIEAGDPEQYEWME